jgi:hypothetical protein
MSVNTDKLLELKTELIETLKKIDDLSKDTSLSASQKAYEIEMINNKLDNVEKALDNIKRLIKLESYSIN